MLARSARLPLNGDYSYELKWDGFRAIVSTEGSLRVRSRRGWDMTPHVAFLAVLSIGGEVMTSQPHRERRLALEELRLEGPQWRTPETFDDGEALWQAVCEQELEGVVAKTRSGRYTSGERGWIKTKNRDYWRWEMEREGALKLRRER